MARETILPALTKSPGTNLDYTIDFDSSLLPAEQITNIDLITVSGGDGLLQIGSASHGTRDVTVRISEGTNGERYHISCIVQIDFGPNTLEECVELVVTC